jgi:hypothetical protein
VRKPTAKEKFVMKTALKGLEGDIEALCNQEPNADVMGTTRVNLEVLGSILERLKRER